ncbi:peptidoglycan DD-metalloendopeptidase family protein [Candidatus Uhrbacteria bacterium]|nr:peptidoglycan DD-metalloendopeptidase family protein [Candidatus Uhrbacteria bacterium]
MIMAMMNNRNISVLVFVFLLYMFTAGISVAQAVSGVAPTSITVLEINEQIQDKKSKITSIRKQIEAYQRNIARRKAEASSLENEVAIIEDDVAQTQLDIEATQTEVDQLELEIREADMNIQQAEAEIGLQKERLGAFIRQLYYNSERDYFEVLLSNDNFSDFFDSVYYLERVHDDLKQTLVRVRNLHDRLLAQRTNLDQQKQRQEELRKNLEVTQGVLEEKRGAKQQLIVQSTLSAEKFQQQLNQARAEQANIDNEIATLERTAREKLKLLTSGPFSFGWPVDPSRGITAYFHDTSYPFRYVFEHPAIDVRAYQGTQIQAAADGYVGRVHENGRAYAYVMLIHDKDFATVYGHMSRIIVKEDTYVKKGQVIGLTGGAPGTYGSGPFTTGPHLHFEIRLKGVPVDPLKYLP